MLWNLFHYKIKIVSFYFYFPTAKNKQKAYLYPSKLKSLKKFLSPGLLSMMVICAEKQPSKLHFLFRD